MKNRKKKKKFKNRYKLKYFVIFFILLILFTFFYYLPRSCKIDLNNYLRDFIVSDSCKQDARLLILKEVKKNKIFHDTIKNILKNIYFNSGYFNSEHDLIKIFNDNDIIYVENANKEAANKKETIKGITENNNNFVIVKNEPPQDSEILNWSRSHGGNFNLKFSRSDFINKNNISDLNLKWKFQAISSDKISSEYKKNIQINPIFINGKLIAVFPDYKIRALSPETGDVFWEISSDFGEPTTRGMLGYSDTKNGKDYLYISFGNRLFKYDINSGSLVRSFGNNGFVRVNTKVAPTIFENFLVVSNSDNIVLFDKDSGKIIRKIEIYNNKNFLGGHIWGGVALDEKNGILFVSTGNPIPAIYGVKRRGNNHRSASLVAVDLKKGSILWDFQETSHDLWDFDIPSPPIIHNLNINNKIYEVVIATTKVGNTLILERKTGKPIFDIVYKKVPKSDIPGEYSEPYQLFIEKPERFSKIEYDEKDFSKLDPDKQKEIKKKLFNSKSGWYEPPSFNKTLVTFGLHGGAQWQGSSLDPFTQSIYIPVNNVPWKIRPFFKSIESFPKEHSQYNAGIEIYKNKCASCHGVIRNGKYIKQGEKFITYIPSLVGNFFRSKEYNSEVFSSTTINLLHKDLKISDHEVEQLNRYFKWWDEKLLRNNEIIINGGFTSWSQFLTDDGFPASNPPWGYIAKLDLVSGNILYKKPLGYISLNNELKAVGTTIYGGLAVNKGGIIFANGTEDGFAYALDANTGEELWKFQMGAAGSSPPIIFVHEDKQYVSFLSTGGMYHNYKNKNSTLYTFTITKK
jgi:quinoprotein glucose dehydrogenase